MALFDRLTKRARENRQRIVLPEGTEPRTLKAADQILAEGLADIILIGSETEIKRMAAELNSSTRATRPSSTVTPRCCSSCAAARA